MKDMLNKKCSCGQGFYVERYLHNFKQKIKANDTKKRNTQTN
jgi:activator of 2-hydroxyglutaryl-CoA dehydratase